MRNSSKPAPLIGHSTPNTPEMVLLIRCSLPAALAEATPYTPGGPERPLRTSSHLRLHTLVACHGLQHGACEIFAKCLKQCCLGRHQAYLVCKTASEFACERWCLPCRPNLFTSCSSVKKDHRMVLPDACMASTYTNIRASA